MRYTRPGSRTDTARNDGKDREAVERCRDCGKGGAIDGSVSRRELLAAAGGAATTTLAGCEEVPDSTPQGPRPDVTLSDVRVVQTVEDSGLLRGNRSMPDPPIVAGEYATVLFDLDVTHPQNLPGTVPVTVTTPTTNFDYTQVLSKADIRGIDDGADAAAVFHGTADASGAGDPPGVQRMPADVREITVKILHQDIDGDEATLTEGSDGDFEVGTLPTLRVGFIHVKDPGDSNSPEFTRAEANRKGKIYTTDIEWGDEDGEAANYRRSVRSSLEYLQRAYPGKVIAYSHDESLPLVGVIRQNWENGTGKDALRARWTLGWVNEVDSFPDNGTVHTDRDIGDQEAIDMMKAIEGGWFDVEVMILPQGTWDDNDDYFTAHGMAGTLGYHWSTAKAVGSLEALADGSDASHAHITAQEIAHRFTGPLYRGGSNNPFSRKADLDNDGNVESDGPHATADLRSVGYDLNDGTYSLVNAFTIQDGNFSPGGTRSSGTGPTVQQHASYMSYAGGTTWADSRIHRNLVEGGYTPGGGGGSPSAGQDGSGRTAPPGEIRPVLELFGSVEDGTVDFQSSTAYNAIPQSTLWDYDPEAHPDAIPVEVTIEGPTGEELATATVPDRYRGSHGHDHESVVVSMPFPELGATVTAVRDGVASTLNPIVHPLRDALRRLPVEAFGNDPTGTRSELGTALDGVATSMSDGDYATARERLEGYEARLAETLVDDYDRFANQPSHDRLFATTERMLARLDALAEAGPAEGGAPVTLELPDGTTRTVEPVESDRTVEAYYGYDRSPSDSSSTPDGLERDDATVTFVYRNTVTGDRSLVCLNGDATGTTDGGGKVPMTFEGVEGYEWQVQDGRPGPGTGDFDPYETEEGSLGESESVIWGWDDSKTDGGAIGRLGETFEVGIVHRAEGTVRDQTAQRSGLDEWLFVDGSDLDSPVRLATFDGDSGDVGVGVSSGG